MGDIVSASEEAADVFVPTISVPCNTSSDPEHRLASQYYAIASFGKLPFLQSNFQNDTYVLQPSYIMTIS
jgi:hypothetical protein